MGISFSQPLQSVDAIVHNRLVDFLEKENPPVVAVFSEKKKSISMFENALETNQDTRSFVELHLNNAHQFFGNSDKALDWLSQRYSALIGNLDPRFFPDIVKRGNRSDGARVTSATISPLHCGYYTKLIVCGQLRTATDNIVLVLEAGDDQDKFIKALLDMKSGLPQSVNVSVYNKSSDAVDERVYGLINSRMVNDYDTTKLFGFVTKLVSTMTEGSKITVRNCIEEVLRDNSTNIESGATSGFFGKTKVLFGITEHDISYDTILDNENTTLERIRHSDGEVIYYAMCYHIASSAMKVYAWAAARYLLMRWDKKQKDEEPLKPAEIGKGKENHLAIPVLQALLSGKDTSLIYRSKANMYEIYIVIPYDNKSDNESDYKWAGKKFEKLKSDKKVDIVRDMV